MYLNGSLVELFPVIFKLLEFPENNIIDINLSIQNPFTLISQLDNTSNDKVRVVENTGLQFIEIGDM